MILQFINFQGFNIKSLVNLSTQKATVASIVDPEEGLDDIALIGNPFGWAKPIVHNILPDNGMLHMNLCA